MTQRVLSLPQLRRELREYIDQQLTEIREELAREQRAVLAKNSAAVERAVQAAEQARADVLEVPERRIVRDPNGDAAVIVDTRGSQTVRRRVVRDAEGRIVSVERE